VATEHLFRTVVGGERNRRKAPAAQGGEDRLLAKFFAGNRTLAERAIGPIEDDALAGKHVAERVDIERGSRLLTPLKGRKHKKISARSEQRERLEPIFVAEERGKYKYRFAAPYAPSHPKKVMGER
jgi:hypothetical protein